MATALSAFEQSAHEILLSRIRGEYLESPGLGLTARQAQRLWGLDEPTCQRAIEDLVESRFLRRSPNGLFARYDIVVRDPPDDGVRPGTES